MIIIAKWQQLGSLCTYRLVFQSKVKEGAEVAKARLELEKQVGNDAMGEERWDLVDPCSAHYLRLMATGLHVSRCPDLWPNPERAAANRPRRPEATAHCNAEGIWRLHVTVAGETLISWGSYDKEEIAKKVVRINEELRRG